MKRILKEFIKSREDMNIIDKIYYIGSIIGIIILIIVWIWY